MRLQNERANTTRTQREFRRPRWGAQTGMTLVEVVVSLAISGVAIACLASGYLSCVISAEKSSLSLAANARAAERVEETRSAKWDTSCWPPVDQLVSSNFPVEVVMLDVSGSGSGFTYATNYTFITQISSDPLLKRIHVDCVWSFKGSKLVTNMMETCRCPDQ